MQDAEQAPTPEHAALAGLLRRKAELELALSASPGDPVLRHAYFDHLAGLAASHVGLCHAALPELGHPLYFRAATPDIGNLVKVFRDQELEVAMAATPRQILVIGAYAGYGAVWLARRFPEAAIACVEPMPSNFRLLALNTAPWPQIRALRMAAWHNARPASACTRRHAADWTVSLEDAGAEELVVPALAVPDLLAAFGWSHADYVLCDAVGAEAAVFADPQAGWLRHLDAAPGGDLPERVAALRTDSLPPASRLPARAPPPGRGGALQRRTPRRAYHRPARRPSACSPRTPELAPLEVHDLRPGVLGVLHASTAAPASSIRRSPGLSRRRGRNSRARSGARPVLATLQHAGRVGAGRLHARRAAGGRQRSGAGRTVVIAREEVGWTCRCRRPWGCIGWCWRPPWRPAPQQQQRLGALAGSDAQG